MLHDPFPRIFPYQQQLNLAIKADNMTVIFLTEIKLPKIILSDHFSNLRVHIKNSKRRVSGYASSNYSLVIMVSN